MTTTGTAQIIGFPSHRREPEPWLKMADLIERYGFSERWWRYRLKEGLPAHRWGGEWRFKASEIEAWMEARNAH